MKTQFNITEEDGKLVVDSYYSNTNNRRFRSVGGVFNGGKGWVFNDTPAVRKMLNELFGEDSPLCRVKVEADGPQTVLYGSELKINDVGYVLAQRRGRDHRVESPAGVELFDGAWKGSGGSVKNPEPTWEDGTVLHAVVRRSIAERLGLKIVEDEESKGEPIDPPGVIVVHMERGTIEGVYSDDEAIVGMEVIFTEDVSQAGKCEDDEEEPHKNEEYIPGRIIYTTHTVEYRARHVMAAEIEAGTGYPA